MNDIKMGVNGLNILNRETKKLLKQALSQLDDLIGKQVILSSGLNSKKNKVDLKYNPGLQRLDDGGYFRIHYANVTMDGYSAWLKVSINYGTGEKRGGTDVHAYFDHSIYVASIKDSCIYEVQSYVKQVEEHKLHHKLTADSVKRKIDKYNKLEEELTKVRYSLPEHFRSTYFLNR